jgi:hypothetical protein
MRASSLHLISIVVALAACAKPDAPSTTSPEDATEPTPVSESNPGPGPVPGDSDPEAPTADDPTTDDPGTEDAAIDEAASADEPAARAPGDPVSVPEDPADGLTEPTSFANVKLEIKQGPKVHKDPGQTIRWEELTRIPIEVEGQVHEFIVHVSRAGEKAEVMMSYNRGGKEILRKFTFDTKIKKREVLRIDDGSALAVTVTPQMVKPAKSAHKKVEKVQGNEPLSGAGKRGEPASTKKKKGK